MKPICLLVCLLTLSACGPAATPTPETTLPPSTTATIKSVPSATSTEVATPSATAIPPSAVCSPLEDHDLAELSLYVTQSLILPLGESKEAGHHGVDFAYFRRDGVGGHILGTPIQSVMGGTVAGSGYATVYGYYVIVETPAERLPLWVIADYTMAEGHSLYLLYAHMQEATPFAVGDPVVCGGVLGAVGGTGDPFYVSNPHLHLETRAGPSGLHLVDMNYYTTQASEEQKATYEFWRIGDTFTLLDPMLLLETAP